MPRAIPTSSAPRRRRGRPAKISQDAIVAAARELGAGSFSMQRLAAHLGVTAPALYAHVSGREEIEALVAEALRRELDAFHSDGEGWRGWLEDFAQHLRRHLAGSAPSVLAGLRDERTAAAVGIGEEGLRRLIDAGLDPTEAGYALWLVFRVAITTGPDQAVPLAGFVADTGVVLGTEVGAALRSTDAVHHALASAGPHDTFAFDLAVILDGIAARIAGPAAARSAPSPTKDRRP